MKTPSAIHGRRTPVRAASSSTSGLRMYARMPAMMNGGSTPRATHSRATRAASASHFDTPAPKTTPKFTCVMLRAWPTASRLLR